ncbi:MAG: nickel-type superoxide dismutase maturation protease [Acidimicrobiales bacterium]
MTRVVVSGAGLVGMVVAALHLVTERFVIDGSSMLPTLSPGDRVLAVRWPVLEAGDIVAFRDPEARERVLVKRIAALQALAIEVLGDNPSASRDSRHFGPVSRRDVVGRVVYRYHPAGHAGRVAEQVRSGSTQEWQ